MRTGRQRAAGSRQLSRSRAASCQLPAASLLVVLLSPAASAAPVSGEEFVIVGEVLKPEITVVISRENLNKAYELKLDEDLLDKIVESVQKAPF
jgi:hypothetical protein